MRLLVLLLVGCRCGAEEATERDAGAPPIEVPTTPPGFPRDDHGLSPEQGATVLARVDGRAITVLDFFDDYERLRGVDRFRFAMPRERGALLEARLREELLADEARRRGYADDPQVRAAREDAERMAWVEQVRREHPVVAPTAAELLALYAAEPERWHRPVRVRAEYVRGTREEAETALAHVRTERDPMRAMREWVNESTSPTVANGQLGPFTDPATGWRDETPVPRAFAAAAHATRAGELHPEVVEADGAWYVVMPVAAEPATEISFEEAHDELVREHARRSFERAIANALPDAEVTIDERVLATVRR
ncbi:MAG: peptidyl-prolyl cis-trans isomerase [Sandaracinus sp.]|nr:peptidyl-prolyl cis-trans isomerase [Sandaracinus sp.]MCB9631089.1 peptidyl-prolyl cis-trans isomerase [Sandaracinus sp.]